MFRRILALIWLRTQVLLSNKNTLVQVLFPFAMVLMFQHFMNTDGTQGKTLLYSCLTMAFSFSSGSMVSSSIAEEKEKKTFKTLTLSGVRRAEYLLSVLFYPVLFALAAIIAFPMMVEVEFAKEYPVYFVIVSLVALCTILVNLFVGA
ncbi:ABC transporter permease, partial [Streptococcus sp. DD10]|uniref:ABC transporter permease n=1 Tax=Streptococcus sp. DD10 TaxID=1777878 RepID=UPI0012E92A2E